MTFQSLGILRFNSRSIHKTKLPRVDYNMNHVEEELCQLLKASIHVKRIYLI